MKRYLVPVLLVVFAIAAYLILKPNPEKGKIESLLRTLADAVQANDLQTIYDSLADEFVAKAKNYEFVKDDFKENPQSEALLHEIEDVQIRRMTISINDDVANIEVHVRATSAKLGQDSPWTVEGKLKKIGGKWLFTSAEIKAVFQRR